eukprot:5445484-Prymnesium_polylepis.1
MQGVAKGVYPRGHCRGYTLYLPTGEARAARKVSPGLESEVERMVPEEDGRRADAECRHLHSHSRQYEDCLLHLHDPVGCLVALRWSRRETRQEAEGARAGGRLCGKQSGSDVESCIQAKSGKSRRDSGHRMSGAQRSSGAAVERNQGVLPGWEGPTCNES